MATRHIKTSGGDDATINLFLGSISDGSDNTGICEESADLLSASATFNVANTGGWVYTLTADSSNQITQPTYSQMTSKARALAGGGDGDAFTISGTGWVIEKIGIQSSVSQGIATSKTCTIRRCVIQSNTASVRVTFSVTVTVSNVAMLKPGNAGAFTFYQDAGTANVHHTSIISNSSGIGFYCGGTVLNTNGCIQQGTTSNDYFGTSGNYNVGQGTGAPGANSLKSQTGVYTNSTAGTEDLTLTSSTTYAIVNRSGYPSDTDTDIAGTSRPSTGADAGCWQNATAPSGPTPIDNTKISRRGTGRTLPIPAIGY